ncbi:hypothetical protein HMPREF9102_2149 [Limosilactobacillus oris F0423]|uniref:Uncharacterized protein n=1 Tax=Limosilactobacillus oris F0423 TaxID=944562 RepID=A0ABP2L7P8_9LACO|nr:hypothetical protein HMPREF9102_2149 [Limosilactobacillus oris F0423]
MKYEKTKAILNQLVADLSQLVMVIHQTQVIAGDCSTPTRSG